MKLHHIRNATLIIEIGDNIILVDPMLGDKGSQPTFTLFRFKPRKNPTVPMPSNAKPILDRVTHCLITHLHPDHLDKEAEIFLRSNNTPVVCSSLDAHTLKKRGLNVTQELEYWKPADFLGGRIIGTPARHGYGFIAKPMGNVMGFFIKIPKQPSIYISSDTIYTQDVEKVIDEFKPDIAIAAAGTAQFDIGKPLLMTLDDITKFVERCPKKVLANHMEAVNHCPTTREILRNHLIVEGLIDKVLIPEDGEVIDF